MNETTRLPIECYSTKRVTLALEERAGALGAAVIYRDGYRSWAPADVIKRDYHPVKGGFLTYGQALESLQEDYKVRRKIWRDFDDSRPYLMLIAGAIHIVTPTYLNHPTPQVTLYYPTQQDMLAGDWEELD